MQCFEVVLKVLDATYHEIPGSEDDRDAAISKALRKMSEQYKRRLLTSGGPDFSDPVTRFAYVFRYVPSHSHWLYELLTWSREALALFRTERLRMSCLGGGPGSDLVGVLKYMAEKNFSPALFCEIVDGCVEWKQTWSDLAFTLDWQTPVHTDYVIHDVTDRKTWNAPNNFAKSDIFTINFFASEIYHYGDCATEYLTITLKKAKPGSLVLLNDNGFSDFYNWIDSIAAESNFQRLVACEGERKIYDRNERLSALGRYAQKFNGNSRLTGKLAWRVFRKY